MPAPSLRIVPDANGEIPKSYEELQAELARTLAVLKGTERDLRGWMVRYRELAEDKKAEAREHILWPLGQHLFRGWQRACDHPKTPWTEDRFWLVEPFLSLPRYAPALEMRVVLCCRAIIGARYDCWKKPQRNGRWKRFDEFDRIFATHASFEDFCNRAPVGWQPTITPTLATLIVQCEARLERQAEAVKLERKAHA